MTLIATIITTPACFPPKDGPPNNRYQSLMAALVDYFPRFVVQTLTGSYAEQLDLDPEEVIVDDFRLAIPGEISGDGVLIYVEFPGHVPNEKTQAQVHRELTLGILTWFRKHDVEPPKLEVTPLWEESGTTG